MPALMLVESPAEVDLCPICGVSGVAACVEEDGQYVLDHFGRSVDVFAGVEEAVTAGLGVPA